MSASGRVTRAVLDQERAVAGDGREQRLLAGARRSCTRAASRRCRVRPARRAPARPRPRRPPSRGWWAAGRPARRPATTRVAGGRRRPRAPPQRASCTTRWATPSWIRGRGALGTPSASNARGRVAAVARRVGEVDRGGRDPGAQASRQRAAPLGVGEAVEGGLAEHPEQLVHRGGLDHHGVLARAAARSARLRRRRLAAAARSATARGVDVAAARRPSATA